MTDQSTFFEHITIHGYRRLLSVSLEMRPLAVMIGANGVGKTSLLEVFSLLAASAKGQLNAKISELSGLNEIMTRDKTQVLAFNLRMHVPEGEPLEYLLRIRPAGQFYDIGLETLTQVDKDRGYNVLEYIDSRDMAVAYFDGDAKQIRPNWVYEPLETALSQAPRMLAEPERLRQRLASCTYYGALNVLPNSPVRLPQPMRPVTLPGANGEDLVTCLYYLRETDPDRFEVVEDTLKAAFPDFEKLSFPPVAAGTLALTWKDRNFSQPFYMNQLSEGTLRFLWLTTLLLSKELTAITLIDEPEVSLHPQLLDLLADLMRDASRRTQLLVATHADRLVRALRPDEVLVCDQEDGVTTLKWGDSFDLQHWLADYMLDELWAMNVLGGAHENRADCGRSNRAGISPGPEKV